MRKKVLIISIVALMMITLGACSSKEKKINSKSSDNEPSIVDIYNEDLQYFISDMNELLSVVNDNIDGLYTQELSKQQFGTIITNLIPSSNSFVTRVTNYDAPSEIFEVHQTFVFLTNRTHQLLLDAVEMANDPEKEIKKSELREEYLSIKEEQANFINEWEQLGGDLKAELKNKDETTKE